MSKWTLKSSITWLISSYNYINYCFKFLRVFFLSDAYKIKIVAASWWTQSLLIMFLVFCFLYFGHETYFKAVRSEVPRTCLLLQQCLGGTDPGGPLPPSLRPPSIFFPVATFRTSPSVILGLWDQPALFFELNSLLPINQIPSRWRPPSTWSPCMGWPPTPTSLWASISTTVTWLWRAWATFSANWLRRSRRAPSLSWKWKPSAAAVPSSRMGRSRLKMSGIRPRTLWKLPFSWRRSWTRPF